MIETSEFLLRAHLDHGAMEAWIEAGWILPQGSAQARQFSDIDVARAQLIRDLKDSLGINDEGVDVILGLLDQMHGLRQTLRALLSAVGAQPEDMRRRMFAEIGGPLEDRTTGESARNGTRGASQDGPP
jgi:chaperone modulatory protein CbpM